MTNDQKTTASEQDLIDAGHVSHDEAEQIATRYHNSHFRNWQLGEEARYTIPADPKRDDDISLDAYIAQCQAIEAERDELRAIVERLPTTADGVPLVPGDIGYARATWLGKDGEVVEFLWNPSTVYAWNDGTPIASWRVPVDKAYSSREAAEAARERDG